MHQGVLAADRPFLASVNVASVFWTPPTSRFRPTVIKTRLWTASPNVRACPKTLYQMFDSKQVLFETLLKERLLVTELHGLTLLGDTVEEQLIYGVSCFADTLLEEKRVNLMRVIITEVSRQPEIGAFVRELFASSSKPHPLRKWLKDFPIRERSGSIISTMTRIFCSA